MNDKRVWIGGLVVVALVAFLIWQPTCGYGEVGERSYDLSMALLSACNRKDLSQIEKIQQLLGEAAAASEVSKQEQAWLQDILQLARRNQWDSAATKVRRLMRDQVVASEPLPKLE